MHVNLCIHKNRQPIMVKLTKELDKLENEGIIDKETALKIAAFLESNKPSSSNRMLLAFGILGALLLGSGIVLLMAHNWDSIPRTLKSIFAFLPLLIGQAACLYILIKKPSDKTKREVSSTFLIFGVAISIALISQIYQLPGSLDSYLLLWSLLTLPIMYIMQSSMASLLYYCLITYFTTTSGFTNGLNPNWYWLLLIAALPFSINNLLKASASNFVKFQNWIIPLSILTCIPFFVQNEALIISYIFVFATLRTLGNWFNKDGETPNNGFSIIGKLGILILLVVLTFEFTTNGDFGHGSTTSTLIASTIILNILFAALIYFRYYLNNSFRPDPFSLTIFPVSITLLILPQNAFIILINAILLALAIYSIVKGSRNQNLRTLNSGLIIITTVAACRFFDTNIDFSIKGIAFILIGAGFFAINYITIKKRRHETIK